MQAAPCTTTLTTGHRRRSLMMTSSSSPAKNNSVGNTTGAATSPAGAAPAASPPITADSSSYFPFFATLASSKNGGSGDADVSATTVRTRDSSMFPSLMSVISSWDFDESNNTQFSQRRRQTSPSPPPPPPPSSSANSPPQNSAMTPRPSFDEEEKQLDHLVESISPPSKSSSLLQQIQLQQESSTTIPCPSAISAIVASRKSKSSNRRGKKRSVRMSTEALGEEPSSDASVFSSHGLPSRESSSGSALSRTSSVLSHVSVFNDTDAQSIHTTTTTTHKILVSRPYKVKEHYLESIFYVSISAILGSVARTYLARIFGQDCEDVNYIPQDVVHDFWTPFTSRICVTSGGRTIQTGGALFYDFPANVLGSFIMGIITPRLDQRRARLPWLHRDHALQRDDVFHASLATGFCGCLTTFASWNTQMVVMLDGSYCELGPQVVPALFGYAIGLLGAAGGFQFGRQVGLWWYEWKHRNEPLEDDVQEDHDDDNESIQEIHRSMERRGSTHQPIELVHDVDSEEGDMAVPNHFHKIPLFLAATGLLAAFLVGDLKADIQFYKGMTLLWIFSPIGSLLRWRLSVLNVRSDQRMCANLPRWLPWGTLAANLSAAALSALLAGIIDRYLESSTRSNTNNPWIEAMLFAMNTGLAGSLSTVSTMVKETVLLSEQHKGKGKSRYYQLGTCLFGMLIGLIIYATTIRI